MPAHQFQIASREKGHTIASVVKARFGLSWARTKRLIEGRHVKIGGQVEADPARRVRPGIRVEVAAGSIEVRDSGIGDRGSKAERREKAEGRRSGKKVQGTAKKSTAAGQPTRSPLPDTRSDLEIVYSDAAVVVVNKPAGVTTMRHAEEADEFGPRGKTYLPKTLADWLPAALGAPGKPVIAVHRLDRDTSGLVVFARTRTAATHLTRQFRKHTVDRRYTALVRGRPTAGRIESILVRDRGDGRRGSGTGPDAKRAVTHVKKIEELGPFAAVECRLETGRTHQVRIHLGEAGTPLCGDRVYDRPLRGQPTPDASGAKRPMLHAARLGFTHPETNEEMTWEAKPPGEFASLWAKLRRA